MLAPVELVLREPSLASGASLPFAAALVDGVGLSEPLVALEFVRGGKIDVDGAMVAFVLTPPSMGMGGRADGECGLGVEEGGRSAMAGSGRGGWAALAGEEAR